MSTTNNRRDFNAVSPVTPSKLFMNEFIFDNERMVKLEIPVKTSLYRKSKQLLCKAFRNGRILKSEQTYDNDLIHDFTEPVVCDRRHKSWKKLLNLKKRNKIDCETDSSVFEIQTNDEFEIQSVDWKRKFNLYFGKRFDETKSEGVIRLLEDLFILANGLIKARCVGDAFATIGLYVKLRTGKSFTKNIDDSDLVQYFNKIFKSEVQSVDFADSFGILRNYIDKYEELKHALIFKKLYKFLMYALSLSLFDNIGISFDTLKYTKIEAEAIRKEYHLGPDFVVCILDTITFLCERGYQCMVTGQMDCIYHSESKYSDWADKVYKTKSRAQFLNNPEPHGFTYFSYLADLNDLIDQGKAISKYADRVGAFEKTLIKRLLADLELIKSTELTKRSALQERMAPFSVLVFGGSSVGKSMFTKLLYYHYGSVFGLDTASEFRYVRNPADPYWVNFNTSQWCVQLDDIAFFHPDKAANGDPSMMEMLQVINNVPFVPTQAALEDKGRTPVKCRLVTATTNTESLNAIHYFSCPFAVRRRLPWIFEVQPKPEYTKNGCMLDPDTLPPLEAGRYPDHWIITVKRVIPGKKKKDQNLGDIEIVHIYNDIYDFLAWFSEAALHYDMNQHKAMDCDSEMQKVEICNSCHYPLFRCKCKIQADDDNQMILFNQENVDRFMYERETARMSQNMESEDIFYTSFSEAASMYGLWYYTQVLFTIVFMYFYTKSSTFRWIMSYFFGITKLFLVWSIISEYKNVMIMISFIGRYAQKKAGYCYLLYNIVADIALIYGSYKVIRSSFHFFDLGLSKLRGTKDSDSTEKTLNEQVEQQSKIESSNIGQAPKPRDDERVNVWYKDDYQTTTFDVSDSSKSYKRFTQEQLVDLIERNTIHIRSIRTYGTQKVTRPTRAVCVKGHVYMANNHALPDDESFDIEIISRDISDGVTSNITVKITQKEIMRMGDLDLCFFRLRCLPPKKDISQLFATSSLRGSFNGFYLGRNQDGSIFQRTIQNIQYKSDFHIPKLQATNFWMGHVNVPTVAGDCGSLMIGFGYYGPVILGIHTIGHESTVGAVCVNIDVIETACDTLEDDIIQAGEPLLESETASRELVKLHHKSPIRYIEEGSANVYGSLSGFRASGKSAVCNTFIHDAVEKRGYKTLHGPPVMSGYEPWRLSLLKMVDPVTKIDQGLLEDCKNFFIKDIFANLEEGEFSDVMVYDDLTAINGAPGVAYVDKINRNTSAGNPWKKSKKYFLESIPPTNGLQDPVKVHSEIMDRVNTCIDTYINGKRFMPNFCAHLKDEPITFKKIEIKKTRVFTGAPFDWTIVVRKYLLSVIRLIQNNRFVFESAPGTIAQSTEWGDIYKYIVQHGQNKVVAGDYSAFDKRMPSCVILAAFDIIYAICKKAGYSKEELLVVKGIAEDTAFPLVDYHGDLIEFYGSNPSGHPLTVIINGLANSLYMRYCYAKLSPRKDCCHFKRHISLMTYGDDNIMGVSDKAPWFNHTSIQKVLADIGIGYTMADKEAESVPYINIKDASFLKRTWRWDTEVQAYLCPLEHDSINKMLTVCVRSKTICPEEQAIAVISTAVREYFYHGREKFDEKRKMFQDIIEECNLQLYQQDSTLPNWQELHDAFWEASQ